MDSFTEGIIDEYISNPSKNRLAVKAPEEELQKIVNSLKDSQDGNSQLSISFPEASTNVNTSSDFPELSLEDTMDLLDPNKSNFICLPPAIVENNEFKEAAYVSLYSDNANSVLDISVPYTFDDQTVGNETVVWNSEQNDRMFTNIVTPVHDVPESSSLELFVRPIANVADYVPNIMTDGRKTKKKPGKGKIEKNPPKKRIRKTKAIDKESDRYRIGREKNNDAVKKCRKNKKEKIDAVMRENERLKELLKNIYCPQCGTNFTVIDENV